MAQLGIAIGSIQTGDLTDDAVDTAKLKKTPTGQEAVTTAAIRDLAVTSAKLAAGAVGTTQIADGSVTGGSGVGAKIAATTITAANIAAGAVTTNELGAAAVTTAKIAAGAVTTNELGATAVTTAKLADSAVTDRKVSLGVLSSFVATSENMDSATYVETTTSVIVSFTPPVARTYLVLFGGNGVATTTQDSFVALSVDDDTPTDTEAAACRHNANEKSQFMRARIVSLTAAAHTLRLKYRGLQTGLGGHTWTNRFLVVIPIGP